MKKTEFFESLLKIKNKPMNETIDVDIVTYCDIYDDTNFMFYKNALRLMKEHLPL